MEGCAQNACFFDAQLAFPLVDVAAKQVVEFIGCHGLLEFRSLDGLAHECVRVEEHVIIKEHVVNANDAFRPQRHVVEEGGTGKE